VGLAYNGRFDNFHLNNGEVKYVKYLEDYDNCLNKYKTDFPAWYMNMKQWRKSLECKKLIKAEFSSDDVGVSAKSLYRFLLQKIRTFIS